MNFVKVGELRINVDRITHVEEVPGGNVYIFFGEHNEHGEAINAVVLEDSEALAFLAFIDVRAADVMRRQ